MATTRRILGCRLVALVVMALVLLTGLGCTASGSDRTGSPVPGAATSTPLPGAGEQVQTSSTRTAEQSTRPTPASRPKVGAGEPSAEIAEIERTVRQRINEIRREQGLAPLEADRELARVARQYSCAMAEQGFFSHTSPSGETVADRVREAGKQYRLVGENIAKLVNPARPAVAAVEGWLQSEGHRENILREGFTETGVGVCRTNDTYYLTQVFMQPR